MVDALTPEVIRAQREKLERKIAEAEKAVAFYRAGLSDLEAAERVIKMVAGPFKQADIFELPSTRHTTATVETEPAVIGYANPRRAHEGEPAHSVGNPFRAMTNKAFIWEVLNQAPTPWLNANQIQERASKLKGEQIPMSSVSPMLSEMKEEYLERDNMLVALKTRLNENGEAEASPDADEVAASSEQ